MTMTATLGYRIFIGGQWRLTGILGAYDSPAFTILQCKDLLT